MYLVGLTVRATHARPVIFFVWSLISLNFSSVTLTRVIKPVTSDNDEGGALYHLLNHDSVISSQPIGTGNARLQKILPWTPWLLYCEFRIMSRQQSHILSSLQSVWLDSISIGMTLHVSLQVLC